MIHILVVDDDKKINQTVCTWLNDCGFAAKGVWSANEPLDWIPAADYCNILFSRTEHHHRSLASNQYSRLPFAVRQQIGAA